MAYPTRSATSKDVDFGIEVDGFTASWRADKTIIDKSYKRLRSTEIEIRLAAINDLMELIASNNTRLWSKIRAQVYLVKFAVPHPQFRPSLIINIAHQAIEDCKYIIKYENLPKNSAARLPFDETILELRTRAFELCQLEIGSSKVDIAAERKRLAPRDEEEPLDSDAREITSTGYIPEAFEDEDDTDAEDDEPATEKFLANVGKPLVNRVTAPPLLRNSKIGSEQVENSSENSTHPSTETSIGPSAQPPSEPEDETFIHIPGHQATVVLQFLELLQKDQPNIEARVGKLYAEMEKNTPRGSSDLAASGQKRAREEDAEDEIVSHSKKARSTYELTFNQNLSAMVYRPKAPKVPKPEEAHAALAKNGRLEDEEEL